MAWCRHGEIGKWVMVRRSGVVRHARAAVQRRNDVVLYRDRGTAMVVSGRTFPSKGEGMTVSATADGATRLMSVTPGDPLGVRNHHDDGGGHRTSTQA
jgi:hypothetical protein